MVLISCHDFLEKRVSLIFYCFSLENKQIGTSNHYRFSTLQNFIFDPQKILPLSQRVLESLPPVFVSKIRRNAVEKRSLSKRKLFGSFFVKEKSLWKLLTYKRTLWKLLC